MDNLCGRIDCGHLLHFIRGWNGHLVQPGDVGNLVAAIKQLLTNDELRQEMGTRARDTVISRFGVKKMIDRSAEELLEMSVASTAVDLDDRLGDQ